MPASANDVIEAVVDHGTYESWDAPCTVSGADVEYRAALARARARSGVDEAVLTGVGRVAGHPVVLIVSEFAFLAGSIGVAAADRIVDALARATRSGLPVLASTASGGTRMQEGAPAFVRMLDISAAVARHRTAGLAYFVHLRHPTTGGVMASWGALGQITLAQPGALLGFVGPRVTEVLTGAPMPEGVQTAENLAARGLVDALTPVSELRRLLTTILGALRGARLRTSSPAARPPRTPRTLEPADTWASVEITRRRDRVTLTDLYRNGIAVLVPLAGTGRGRPAIHLGLASVAGVACVLIAQDRRSDQPIRPHDLRAARRAMALAEEWRLPVITVIDTPGADLSAEAENSGLAFAIAQCVAALPTLAVPSVAVLLGQGAGGAALALLGARRVIATQHAWLAPLPPEGASAIIHRDTGHAPDLTRQQRIGAPQLFAAGIVHHVVPEPDGQAPDDLAAAVTDAVTNTLKQLPLRPDRGGAQG
ncbi:carboxyl transferase domain-containing protein [Jiangella alba]|uniref:Acetyl-coenzyme A carboxylase carboxyl transferase subunits beta/alpha n=1 Tax=Jiangella alba TaxID=561176 RepID=A0A1H5Q0B7_9ACTN|nr:carboxyl transferase domain-containing protein [Jiangella alba]SEF18687.1 acetyl-CoA carboxylase carboxyl transferase subunit beta [Jiangella alba]